MINFYKYQGAGNDFILIDNRMAAFVGDKVAFVRQWCDRRFGIGSDGLIFIENCESAQFEMDFYNPDGSQSFCGNGSRCAVAFAKFLGIVENDIVFKAIDGLHHAALVGDQVKIYMNQVGGIEKIGEDDFIDTGSPHYISYCGADDNREIVAYGKSIRYSERFKEEGTNVNLIREIADHHIAIQTYERGVENETLACGTGATACGLSYAALQKNNNSGIVKVDVKGGKLKIHYNKTNQADVFTNIWLEGPAEFVFKGVINA
ncbi:MAG: diaminopimelate epimerase [Crocinitomix sp.]|nr:diaminopimelate epimerase [Crocinitomix sp.]